MHLTKFVALMFDGSKFILATLLIEHGEDKYVSASMRHDPACPQED